MKRELASLKKLKHRNIVHLHEVYASERKAELLFEYLDCDLFGLIKTGVLLIPQAKSLSRQLLEGLAFMHAKGYIHRDIKCEKPFCRVTRVFCLTPTLKCAGQNILISTEGLLKIADLGLARQTSADEDLTNRVVSLWYRSPELLLGETRYSTGPDIWSAGYV